VKQSHVRWEANVQFFFLLFAALISAPALAAPQTATINGAEISYEVCGDEKAPGVVLLHDGMANSAVWDDVFPILCKQYRVVRYDRRGYGKSPPAKEPHSPADDLKGVMDHAGLTHAHLVGASAGAGIAIDFLFEYPEGIDKLVLVAPALSGFTVSDKFLARLQVLEEHIRKGDMDATIAAIGADPHFFGPGGDEGRKKLAAILRASPGDLGAHPFQRRPPNVAARLQEIYAPTLLVIGMLDDSYNQAVVAAMQPLLRAAQVDGMTGVGQFLYLENPVDFAATVTPFLG